MPPPRHPLDKGYRAHNCNVYPQRPDRCYLAYIDGGMHVLDISDKANPKRISSWTNSPPYTGFMHTVVPLFDRGLMLVTDEFDREQRQGLAEARLDPRRARRDQPRADLDLPAAGPQGLCGARPVRRPQHPRERAAADLLAVRPDRARHLLQRRLARLRHLQPVPAAGDRDLRAAAGRPARRPARPRSTTCSSTSARSSTASTATSAGCTAWRWISDRGSLARTLLGSPPCAAGSEMPSMTDTILDLFPSHRRQVRPAAEARARLAAAGDDRHRLPRRREDHAGAAVPGNAGGPRHRADRQRVRLGRHRRRAAAREQRRGDAARQRLPVLQHPHAICRSRCAGWSPTATAARSRISAAC